MVTHASVVLFRLSLEWLLGGLVVGCILLLLVGIAYMLLKSGKMAIIVLFVLVILATMCAVSGAFKGINF